MRARIGLVILLLSLGAAARAQVSSQTAYRFHGAGTLPAKCATNDVVGILGVPSICGPDNTWTKFGSSGGGPYVPLAGGAGNAMTGVLYGVGVNETGPSTFGGTPSGNQFTLNNLSTIATPWTLDVTSPATALASLSGTGTALANGTAASTQTTTDTTTKVATDAFVANQTVVNGGSSTLSLVGTPVFLTGQTSTTTFLTAMLTSAPAGLYAICPTISVTASTEATGTVAIDWQTTKTWSSGTTGGHTIIGASSITSATGPTDYGAECVNFYSGSGATINLDVIFASITTGSVTYNLTAVLERLE